jgi:predicted SnoaL-like aldol condensation-catalyzing enzyme
MNQEITTKSIIRDFYRRAIAQGDIAFAEEIIADDYIQHSPTVKPGKAGLLEAIQAMKQMPKPTTPASPPFMRLIAEGDYVVTNMSFDWSGKRKAVIDLFRFQNGQVAEHWDVMQDQTETTVNGNELIDGPMPIDDNRSIAENKELIRKFYQDVLINRQVEALPDFAALDLIQHKPDIANGLSGLWNYLQLKPDEFTIEKVHRLIAEGDFVVVQSEGKRAQKLTMFYDVFRLKDGKIVEQWGL